MLSVRNLAHVAAIVALAAVGLTLGLWLRDPHPGGLAFVLIFAAVVAVLLWRLYRPGGIVWAPRADPAPERVEAATETQTEDVPPTPAEPEPTEPAPAAPVVKPPSSTGARRIELPKEKRRLVLALALGALLLVIAVIAWPDSGSAPKTVARPASPAPASTRPQAKSKPKPAPRRVAPKARPRPAAPKKASARGLGSATLRPDSKGPDVSLLQRLLRVKPSGRYDAKTEAAVRRFQNAKKLPTTGVVATLTHKALRKAFP